MLYTLDSATWQATFHPDQQTLATRALEEGQIIYLPKLNFELTEDEKALLNPACLEGKAKNISYIPSKKELRGAISEGNTATDLKNMMNRFVKCCNDLIDALIPYYQPSLALGRTSYRPIEIAGRKSSVRKDDTRLHVDAFPATPTQGKRILRVFSNINPNRKARVWNSGEPFNLVVQQFKSKLTTPWLGSRSLLSLLKITKSYRTLYDHYMLQIHDKMKMDQTYQDKVEKQNLHFPPGATWIVMTDVVSHAALSGQYLLEQTFYLPCDKMQNPECAPLRILESELNKPLLC